MKDKEEHTYNPDSKNPSILLVIEDEFASSYERIKKEAGDNVKIVGNGDRSVSDEEILDAMKEMQGENKDNPVHVVMSQHGAEKLRNAKGDYNEHNTVERINKVCEHGAASVDLFSCYGGTLFENDELAKRGADNDPPITVSANRKHTAPTIESDLEIIDTIKDITDGKSTAERRMDSVMRDTETKYYSKEDKNTGPKVSKENYEQEKEVITDDEKLKGDIKRRVEHAAKSSGEPLDSDLVTSKKDEIDSYSKDDVNAYRKKVFQTASWRGNEEGVKASLEVEGAIDVNEKGKDGMTAMHRAALENNPEVLDILLSQEGANVDAKNNKDLTPLHYAAEAGSVEAAKKLLENGAEVNDEGSILKNTPLHQATKSAENTMEMAELLLANGANPDLKNYFDKTPKGLAEERGKIGVAIKIDEFLAQKELEASLNQSQPEEPSQAAPILDLASQLDWMNTPADRDDSSVASDDSFLANLEAEMQEFDLGNHAKSSSNRESKKDNAHQVGEKEPQAKGQIEKSSSKMKEGKAGTESSRAASNPDIKQQKGGSLER